MRVCLDTDAAISIRCERSNLELRFLRKKVLDWRTPSPVSLRQDGLSSRGENEPKQALASASDFGIALAKSCFFAGSFFGGKFGQPLPKKFFC